MKKKSKALELDKDLHHPLRGTKTNELHRATAGEFEEYLSKVEEERLEAMLQREDHAGLKRFLSVLGVALVGAFAGQFFRGSAGNEEFRIESYGFVSFIFIVGAVLAVAGYMWLAPSRAGATIKARDYDHERILREISRRNAKYLTTPIPVSISVWYWVLITQYQPGGFWAERFRDQRSN